jgi:hypothetical protein
VETGRIPKQNLTYRARGGKRRKKWDAMWWEEKYTLQMNRTGGPSPCMMMSNINRSYLLNWIISFDVWEQPNHKMEHKVMYSGDFFYDPVNIQAIDL